MGAVAYEKDFYGWTQEQAGLLQRRQFDEIDLEHLIEEVDSMGKAERNQLRNRLTILLMHLLKWQYQPAYRGSSWVNTIREQRRAIPRHIKDNPSLKSSLDEILFQAYSDSVEDAADETGLPLNTFPESCLWSFDVFMNRDFWPEAAE